MKLSLSCNCSLVDCEFHLATEDKRRVTELSFILFIFTCSLPTLNVSHQFRRKLDIVTFPSGEGLVLEHSSSLILVSHKNNKVFSMHLIFKKYRFTGKKLSFAILPLAVLRSKQDLVMTFISTFMSGYEQRWKKIFPRIVLSYHLPAKISK